MKNFLKYVVIVSVGALLFQQVHTISSNTTSLPQPEVKQETLLADTTVTPVPTEVPVPTPTPDVVATNPQGCNQETQWIYSDGSCHDKEIVTVTAGTVMSFGSGDCEPYRYLIQRYSWNVEVAMNVCRVESRGNPNASNWNDHHATCSASFGLFQINCGRGQLYDPAQNVATAYSMWIESGWTPWGFTTCKIIACF